MFILLKEGILGVPDNAAIQLQEASCPGFCTGSQEYGRDGAVSVTILLLFWVVAETLKYWTTKDHLSFPVFEDMQSFDRSREGKLTHFFG